MVNMDRSLDDVDLVSSVELQESSDSSDGSLAHRSGESLGNSGAEALGQVSGESLVESAVEGSENRLAQSSDDASLDSDADLSSQVVDQRLADARVHSSSAVHNMDDLLDDNCVLSVVSNSRGDPLNNPLGDLVGVSATRVAWETTHSNARYCQKADERRQEFHYYILMRPGLYSKLRKGNRV